MPLLPLLPTRTGDDAMELHYEAEERRYFDRLRSISNALRVYAVDEDYRVRHYGPSGEALRDAIREYMGAVNVLLQDRIREQLQKADEQRLLKLPAVPKPEPKLTRGERAIRWIKDRLRR